LDLWGRLNPKISQAFEIGKQELIENFGAISECNVVLESVDQMLECFRAIQGYEAWELHGNWISKFHPNFGPGVRDRFSFASQVSRHHYEAALTFQRRFQFEINALLANDGVLVLPTVGDVSPLIESSHEDLEDYRRRAFSLLCVAGLAGLPQISLPLAVYQGAPLGLSLVGWRGGDAALISYAARLLKLPARGDM
jgi:amidase